MAGLFNPPKLDLPTPPNPYDTQNRLADAMTKKLQSGGSQGDTLSGTGAGVGLGLPLGSSGSKSGGAGAGGGTSGLFAGLGGRTGLT